MFFIIFLVEKFISYGSFVPQSQLKETVSYYDNSVYSYEKLPEEETINSKSFLLPNTMAKVRGKLRSIELYGHRAGTIKISVTTF